MKLWLLLGLMSYFSFVISTSIDKHLMAKGENPINVNTYKILFNGIILLIIGYLFFDLNFDSKLIYGQY